MLADQKSTVWKIMKRELKLKAYKIQLGQQLSDDEFLRQYIRLK